MPGQGGDKACYLYIPAALIVMSMLRMGRFLQREERQFDWPAYWHIAAACGFSSLPRLTDAYSRFFHHPPTAERI
ncbi:hypothetical protein [Citrobacter rodentium]|uniref:Membrane protein n=2 Tax=Citrobacter rodentium TaxID=67825 RepID=D2TU13_CITRI|nr:hypothetical protein [Citrobacter rodentium]QBY28998.1 hypothetical protein E2R62_09065 [Citrobacter rodentium]UHO29144.1 helix-turn-helix domain-containing protein [Citrobacter rodentium NBRC 105723 = DSM 16636]CBG89245.1 putative membrane protein [Citrobacter rodentium ICC168]HAT8014721.1 hypothetical protein [Citrobacter rodentium NBRC 105723 = DSM 16636]HAT8019613.1 hypothetical protein [Citrobacter rodentium]